MQNCSAEENELSSMEEEKSECAIKKQKDANNEVTYNVTNYFNVYNVFEYGRKHPEVSCERVYMATKENIFVDTLNKYQDRHGQRL